MFYILGAYGVLFFLSILSATLYHLHDKKWAKEPLQFRWLFVYTFIAVALYFVCSRFAYPNEEAFVFLMEFPFYYFISFCYIWLFCLRKEKSWTYNIVMSIVKIAMLIALFIAHFIVSFIIATLPEVAYFENFTPEETKIVEKVYAIQLPKNIESDFMLIDSPFLSGGTEQIAFELSQENWETYKLTLDGHYEAFSLKNSENVLVVIENQNLSMEYADLSNEHSTVLNNYKYKLNYKNKSLIENN